MMGKIKEYFRSSFRELGRVTWPTKNRAVNICVLVVGFVAISMAFIAGVDFLFNRGYALLLSYAQTITLK